MTFSLLSRYLGCKERFRVLVTEGWQADEGFNHRLEYGNMWHVCEQALAEGADPTNRKVPLWETRLKDYAVSLARKAPLHQEKVDHWHRVCKAQFPLYVEHWSKHPDVQNRTPIMQEECFEVQYQLPSGRVVLLRGKWDSVDVVKGRKQAGIWVQENKTKGDVYEPRMVRQLTFDLQTMIYVVALDAEKEESFWRRANKAWRNLPILGVRYNVIRRPLSGGKGTIVRGKATQGAKCPKCKGHGTFAGVKCPKCNGKERIGGKPEETKEHFYDRVRDIIASEPESWFMRWNVDVSPADVKNFRRQCLDPILENLVDDWEWWDWCSQMKGGDEGSSVWDYLHRAKRFPAHQARHYRHPFGLWNVLDEGGSSDLDEYLSTGSTVGLRRVENLFPELTEVRRAP